MKLVRKPMVAAIAAALVMQGCVTTQGGGIKETLKETFNSDDPCANSKRNIGIAVGAITGAVVGSAVSGKKDKALGAVVGALAGGGLGGLIGRELDKRECEIFRLQEKHNVAIDVTRLNVATDANAKSAEPTLGKSQQPVGFSVAIADKSSAPQFASGSDQLSPEALELFKDLASKYTPPTGKDEESKKLAQNAKNRYVLLIGHTDDTGDTKVNAQLSERRAKRVAQVFKEAGVPESNIFYQGAGETFPIADNATEEGRAKNRRVEVVDLPNKEAFQVYLDNRRPNTAFYRQAPEPTVTKTTAATKEAAPAPAKTTTTTKTTEAKSAPSTTTAQAEPTPAKSAATAKPKLSPGMIDFGGKPFSTTTAKVNAGEIMQTSSSGFSLISEARASDIGRIETCNVDRPRNAGLVKSLKDGKSYSTADYLPGFYGRTWADMPNGNLVVLNKVTVLRSGLVPANKPELKVYPNYNPKDKKDPAPAVSLSPDVNVYETQNGILYRVFANGDRGLQCMDVLIPQQAKQARDGKIIYGSGADFVSDFKPRVK